jgi:hypothetical protein
MYTSKTYKRGIWIFSPKEVCKNVVLWFEYSDLNVWDIHALKHHMVPHKYVQYIYIN